MMMIRVALLGVLLAGLVGCGGGLDTAGETSDDAAAGNNRPSEDASAEARRVAENEAAAEAKAKEDAEREAASKFSKFGQTYTWEDGVAVTVGPPAPFQPSEYSAVDGAAAHLGFTVTILNGTTAPFDASMFLATAQSGNTEAEQVFDSAQGYEGSPSTTLLPGREATFKIGFGVTTPADVVMEVAPSFEHQSTIFTT